MDNKKIKDRKTYNALDLFCGAGGFSIGMEQAGVNVVASVEYDSNIAKTYRYNNPETHLIVDDIRKIRASQKDVNTEVFSYDDRYESIEDIFKKKCLFDIMMILKR